MDIDLITDFLEENFEDFQNFLDQKGIAPSEAEVIIDRLKTRR